VKHEIVVVGAGAMGSAAALALARRGCSVVMVESRLPGHQAGSSHGDGRIIRYSYAEPVYVALARRAYAGWQALERAAGVTLLETTGGLDLGPRDSEILAGLATALAAQEVRFEPLTAQALMQRFPQIRCAAGSEAIYQADGGVVRADRAWAVLWRLAAAAGVRIAVGSAVETLEADDAGVAIGLASGTRLTARHLVLAAGAWNRSLAAQLGLDLPLITTREHLAYFPVRPRGVGHGLGQMPTIIDYHSDDPFYALPQVSVPGVKCGWHRTGPTVDPDAARGFDHHLRTGLRRWVETRLPQLIAEPIRETTCLYTNTPDCDFLLDRHPTCQSVVIAGGFSGHGFKFVPAIGDLVAALTLDEELPMALDAFRIDRFK